MKLSTDHQIYLSATTETFGPNLDYAMVVKEFRSHPKPENTKYSQSPDPGRVARSTYAMRHLPVIAHQALVELDDHRRLF